MKITLTDENGKSIQLNIADEEYSKLFPAVKKTGYERVKEYETYYVTCSDIGCSPMTESPDGLPNYFYINANYYSSKTVAENNARADKLMRQLRRFAVEHREKELEWKNNCSSKFKIVFDQNDKDIYVDDNQFIQLYGAIYFDTKKIAQLAIDTFKDELLWYFTEYKDSL